MAHTLPGLQSSFSPSQNAMHVPMFFSFVFMQMNPSAQSSTPLTPEPSTRHGSPSTPSPVIATQRFAFQNVPPSFAHAVHFCPSSQSCTFGSHSFALPPSGGTTKLCPSSSPLSSALPGLLVASGPD